MNWTVRSFRAVLLPGLLLAPASFVAAPGCSGDDNPSANSISVPKSTEPPKDLTPSTKKAGGALGVKERMGLEK